MSKKRIFVSCGQRTEDERNLGQKIIKQIGDHGMLGFFAEEAHEPADLNSYLFKELQLCNGFVAVLQKRGEVHYPGFPTKQRASVWIQQEIAILFYRSFLLGRPIPMRVYAEKDIIREGLITMSIINPIEFENEDNLLQNLSAWLRGPAFEEQPLLARRENLFQRRIQNYNEYDWLVLELIAAHSRNPGDTTNHSIIRRDFFAIVKETGKSEQEADRVYNEGWSKLTSDGVITRTDERGTGITVLRIETQWWDLVLEELRNRARIT